ncbi:hypothetical protein LOK49_LG14G00360 [Camellia lanceoleosa]|uniref:Uncharacterized protein n=1 Tax=Camellia lanceoleosa TaxID=1840588 RepID=A0ACC0FBN5_9ERIC|nr:hypothetical protein LOK49_LG14G00360 [Camellia lanceoleosa]
MTTTTPLPSIAITHPFSNLHNHYHRYGGQESSGRHWKVKETLRMKEKNREDKVQKWETRCKFVCRVVWGASHRAVHKQLQIQNTISESQKHQHSALLFDSLQQQSSHAPTGLFMLSPCYSFSYTPH